MKPLGMWVLYRNRAALCGRSEVPQSALDELARIGERRREGASPEAVRAALGALARELPDWPLVHTTRAIWDLQEGRVTEAKLELAVALATAPGNPLPYKMLAGILKREGEVEVAEAVRAQWRRVARLRGIETDGPEVR